MQKTKSRERAVGKASDDLEILALKIVEELSADDFTFLITKINTLSFRMWFEKTLKGDPQYNITCHFTPKDEIIDSTVYFDSLVKRQPRATPVCSIVLADRVAFCEPGPNAVSSYPWIPKDYYEYDEPDCILKVVQRVRREMTHKKKLRGGRDV